MFSKIVQLWQGGNQKQPAPPKSISFGRALAHVTWCQQHAQPLSVLDIPYPEGTAEHLKRFDLKQDMPLYQTPEAYIQNLLSTYCVNQLYFDANSNNPDKTGRDIVAALQSITVEPPSYIETFKNIARAVTQTFTGNNANHYTGKGTDNLAAAISFHLCKPKYSSQEQNKKPVLY